MTKTAGKKKRSYKCVYCGACIDYEGSCLTCGEKEDRALGKYGDVADLHAWGALDGFADAR